MRGFAILFTLSILTACRTAPKALPLKPLVLTTDFGLRDGAVSAMKGVAYGVDERLVVSDLTHEIPPFDVWQSALRLQQTYRYWPAGTVFVTVVDPGVGSARRSLVALSKSGHIFVGPDNGHLSLIADEVGLQSVRILDERTMRRGGSDESYTFHGRDLYAYVGAQLASGRLDLTQTGPEAATPIVRLNYQRATTASGMIQGMIPILDPNYGNVWTNVPKSMVQATFGDARELRVYVAYRGRKAFEGKLPVVNTFAGVAAGQPLLYFNSLLNLALALNQGNFARVHQLGAGPEWTITISKP